MQQILTLAGVLLGATATFVATTFTERAKWRRSLDTRWDDNRLAAYSEYGNALKRYVQAVYRLAAAQGYPAATQPIDIEAGQREMEAADSDRSIKWELLLLLGSPEAVAAARNWNEAAWRFSHVVRGVEVDHDTFYRLFETTGRRRNEFYECARADLGVHSGKLPPGDRAWRPIDGGLASEDGD